MSLSKEKYDKARKKASERLENWVKVAQEDQGNGIARLISRYPGVLRRIQFDKTPANCNVHHNRKPSKPVDLYDTQRIKKFLTEEKYEIVTELQQEKKPFSSSAENIPVPPTSPQRKTNSDGSLCEIRNESQKSRFSRRSSRLSTEDPFRVRLWSSRDLNEPCSSKLSYYGISKDTDCLEVAGKGLGKRNSSRQLSAVIPSPSSVSRKSFGRTTSNSLTPLRETSERLSKNVMNLLISRQNRHKKLRVRGIRSARKSGTQLKKRATTPASALTLSIACQTTPVSTSAFPKREYTDAVQRLIKLFKKVYNIILLFKCTCRQLSGQYDNKQDVFQIVEDGKVLTFDPREFRATSKKCGGLSKRARKALIKEPGQRGRDDIASLHDVINRMPVFAKYSRHVKEALADRLLYDQVGEGRVVVKQGQIGSNVYCVVSGVLGCRMSDVDPRTGENIVTHFPDIKEGSTFGELAFVRDLKRSATVVCKSDCELLVLKKDDFNDVMRETWEFERRERLEFLQQSKHFRSWTQDELATVADLSQVTYYNDNDVVLGDVTGISPVIYFIMSGACRVVKQVRMVRLRSPYQPSLYQLPHVTSRRQFLDKMYTRIHRHHEVDTHNLTIIELGEGDFMGVGENLHDIHVIANGKVRCLAMNSVQFEIFAKKEELRRMSVERQELLPDNVALHRLLSINRNWDRYKRRVVEEVVARKKITDRATLTDVPWSIRMEPRV